MSRPPTGPELAVAVVLGFGSICCSIFGLVHVLLYFFDGGGKFSADIAVVFSLLGLGLAVAFILFDPSKGRRR